MKKIWAVFILFVCVIVGCSNEIPLVVVPEDSRNIEELVSAYQQTLTRESSAENDVLAELTNYLKCLLVSCDLVGREPRDEADVARVFSDARKKIRENAEMLYMYNTEFNRLTFLPNGEIKIQNRFVVIPKRILNTTANRIWSFSLADRAEVVMWDFSGPIKQAPKQSFLSRFGL